MIKRIPLLFRILVLIAIVALVFSVLFFIIHFHNQNISTNIDDWGYFGSYFGGILSPFISLLSLIVIGYISYQIAKDDVSERRKQYVIQEKNEAHKEILKYPSLYKLFYTDFLSEVGLYNAKLKRQRREVDEARLLIEKSDYLVHNYEKDYSDTEIESLEKYRDSLYKFQLYYSNIPVIRLKYNHLFKYDFYGEDFNNLVSTGEEIEIHISKQYELLLKAIEGEKAIESISFFEEKILTHQNLIISFVHEISKEIPDFTSLK